MGVLAAPPPAAAAKEGFERRHPAAAACPALLLPLDALHAVEVIDGPLLAVREDLRGGGVLQRRPYNACGNAGALASYALATSVNFFAAASSPGFLSGWYFRESLRYAFLMVSPVASLFTARTCGRRGDRGL